MFAHVIKLADGSSVVFDRKSKEAFVLPPHSLHESDPAKALLAASGLVKSGQGARLTKSQLEALSAGLAHVALLG
jgi:hypothetical protein